MNNTTWDSVFLQMGNSASQLVDAATAYTIATNFNPNPTPIHAPVPQQTPDFAGLNTMLIVAAIALFSVLRK